MTVVTKPVRLRLSRARGFDLQAASRAGNGLPAVNVARPSIFGNPFPVTRVHDRAYVVHLFSSLMCCYTALVESPSPAEQENSRLAIFRNLGKLTGSNLACWCALDGKPCHADVLLLIANDSEQRAARERFACGAISPAEGLAVIAKRSSADKSAKWGKDGASSRVARPAGAAARRGAKQ